MNKRIRNILASAVILSMALSAAACSSGGVEDPEMIGGQTTISVENNGNEGGGNVSGDFGFTYSGVKITMNADSAPILSALGDDYSYFESDSCAYQGMDKIFTFPHFAIYTYPDGDKDMVSSVEFKTDAVATEEGIRIASSTRDDVIAAYGSDFQESDGIMKYTRGNCVISFKIEDNAVAGVVYDYADLRTE